MSDLFKMAWKNKDEAGSDWSVDEETKPMPAWAMAAFLDDLGQHCPHLDVKSVPSLPTNYVQQMANSAETSNALTDVVLDTLRAAGAEIETFGPGAFYDTVIVKMSAPVEHTILDPSGTRYENQDPRQLDAIDTQSRGERA